MVKTKINNHRGHRGNRHHAAEILVTYSQPLRHQILNTFGNHQRLWHAPQGRERKLLPRQVITPEVNSILISSPGIIVLSEDPANCSRKRFASSGTSTHKKPLLNAFRK